MLRITQSDLSAVRSELERAQVNTSALSLCHDPMTVFGDAELGNLVYRVQQLVAAAATSLAEATAAQSTSIKKIDATMESADQTLALGAQ